MVACRHVWFAVVLLTPLCACAPSQQGADQCKDSNVDLLALSDAKFIDLPEAEGGLSPAMRDDIDGAVGTFMSAHGTAVAGCALAVTRHDRIAYLQGYGFADTDADREFTIATPAPVGSIAKTLTALGLLVYVEQNKLNLDLPLLDQMGLQPGIDVGWAGNPTLRQVLAHKGGFIAGSPAWDAAAFDDGPTIAAAFPNVDHPGLQPLLVFQGYKAIASNQDQFQIGLTPWYSNVGYSVLGALLDYRSRAADTPAHMQGYERFIWHKVARGSQLTGPAMTSACLATDFRTTDIKNLARGYAEDGSPLSFGDSASTGWGWEGPSGGWTMTIGDLARLMLILQSSAVVDKDTIDTEMREDNGVLFNNGTRVGLGLELDANATWFGKGGDILGYTADMKIWPSVSGESWGVAFMCNQRFAGKSLTGDVHDLLDAGPSVGGLGRGADARPQSAPDPAIVALAKRYEPVVRAHAARYLARGDSPEQAWARARQDLARLPNGSRLVQALERGDFEAALRLLPAIPQANTVTTR
jgi:CubicO group peptidase (beta-lactamase class C family)